MIAHIDPLYIFAWLGCVVVSLVLGGAALVSSVFSMQPRRWTVLTGAFVIPIGGWVTWVAYNDGARMDWVMALCVAPILFGIMTVIRWRFVNKDRA